MRIDEITMIDETMQKLNRTVIGAVYIDYPVYLVHLEYKKKNDDPMYFIDWAVVHFMKIQPRLDLISVPKLIGMDYGLVQYRIKILKEQGLIIEDNSGFKITDAGELCFFDDEEDVPYINASSDFLIDGKDLSIMPNVFYEDKGYITFEKNSIFPRKIIDDFNDPLLKKLLVKLEKFSREQKVSVKLPAECKDFYFVDRPTPGLLRMYLVFSCDENNNFYKDVVYSSQIVNLPSLKKIIENSYFNDGMNYNYGYDNSNIKGVYNQIFSFSNEGVKEILSELFNWNEVSRDWFVYDKESNLRPLSVNINMENFLSSWNRRKLISCFNIGYNEFNSDDFYVRITVSSKDNNFLELIQLDNDIEDSKITCNLTNIDEIFDKYGEDFVRKRMIELERFDCLEIVDNRNYITQEERK